LSAPRLDAILLAAGHGRRLGAPKAGLELRGRWMLPALVHALRAGGADRVVLVLSAGAERAIAERPPHGADAVVRNPDPDAGRTGSLLAGLDAVDTEVDGVLVHPCDVPLLAPRVVHRLISAWSAHADRAELLARPVTPAGRGGHPLLVGSARLTRLRQFGPDQPLRQLLDEDRSRVLDVAISGDPGPFFDVDTAEQLALLENLLESASAPEPPPASGA
jgi:molybdenum cofactor cytidylyltransferase